MGAAAAGDELAAVWEKAEVGAGKDERILVSVRLRPLNAKEAERGDSCDWECISPTTVMFRNTLPERAMFPTAYTYDRVFSSDCTTRRVYEEGAKEVALSVVSGINSSIFAYGQTSSGKTYTMTGITEYSISDIYDYIEKHSEREFILKFSAIEIYNEAVRDLLSHDTTPLRLLDDPEKGTTVEKLTEETLRDQDHLRELLSVCEAQRQIGETALNEMSSRSHQILRLTIESSARQYLGRGSSSTLVACVNFVDLAGSERASQTASAGMRLKEGSHINRSLLTLGKVIRQLRKGRNGHIPYRDSKLTRILQSSLGGNARTAIICTMSPAHSHIEQSRNTLLFATCAKEVVTNAQVNVVMSDKALVKHLQRELARLENEMKFPGSASCTTHAEALREKDAQIKKLEKELEELMEQRDIAQSRLDDLLKGPGDDHGDDRTSQQWDERSQSSESLARNVSEDALSVSETYGVAYQDQDLGCAVFDASHVSSGDHHDTELPEQTLELPERTLEFHERTMELPERKMELSERTMDLMSPRHSPSNHSSDGIEPYQRKEVASRAASEVSEEHCKEVQCIEINELNRSRSQEFNLFLPEETGSLLALTDADKLEYPEVEELSKDAVLQPEEEQQIESVTKRIDDPVKLNPCEEEQQVESITKKIDDSVKPYPCESNTTIDNPIELYTCESNLSFDLGKPYPDEALALKRCVISSRDSALTRSRSCRASFMIIPNSWFDDSEDTSRTPPDDLFKYVPGRSKKVRRSPYSQNDDYRNADLSLDGSVASEKIISDKVAKDKSTGNAEEDSIINDISCVTEPEEMTEKHYTEQLQENQQNISEDSRVEKTVKDVGIDSALSTIESPSQWPIDFEKKQEEIIELWHACNVSLVHRTYFFLLFKGDPADNIYMEVEHRRLSFIKNSFTAKSAAEGELNAAVASSLKNLRREREMLYRQMLKKLSLGERESLYTKWGIALNSKQRRLQLSRCIWTQTDMEHVRESASLVAKLIELLDPGQALKEMFGLSLTLTPRADRRSFSWVGSYSLK